MTLVANLTNTILLQYIFGIEFDVAANLSTQFRMIQPVQFCRKIDRDILGMTGILVTLILFPTYYRMIPGRV